MAKEGISDVILGVLLSGALIVTIGIVYIEYDNYRKPKFGIEFTNDIIEAKKRLEILDKKEKLTVEELYDLENILMNIRAFDEQREYFLKKYGTLNFQKIKL